MKNKLPIGIQGFTGLRNDGYLYVDKTEYIYKAVHGGKQYFLSRPRRFGKSLLLSAFRAYWEGKKDLFRGLAIERLEQNNPEAWESVPVFYLDLNRGDYRSTSLEQVLENQLRDWEAIYGERFQDRALGERFQKLLEMAAEKTGHRCVILVDEYDKPLLDVIDNAEMESRNRQVFKGFFSALKSCDEYIRFVFVAGVTKFSKVSIFSDLNNFTDISMDPRYVEICGITEREIHDHIDSEVEELAMANDLTKEECFAQLKDYYDGYHFRQNSVGLYNPFSLLNTLSSKVFSDYWFETGTPTFLVEILKKTNYNLNNITRERVTGDVLGNISDMYVNPIPVIYQSGYLTIKGYDKRFESYHLGFPNREVEKGFVKYLSRSYSRLGIDNSFSIDNFVLELEAGKVESFMRRLEALFADNDYRVQGNQELYFQNVLYVFFKLLGFYVEVERPTSDGRMDMIVKTADYIFIFEFKLDKSADEALQQIEDKGYALPYAADPRRLYKIGVNFSSERRCIGEWKIVEG